MDGSNKSGPPHRMRGSGAGLGGNLPGKVVQGLGHRSSPTPKLGFLITLARTIDEQFTRRKSQ
jgi:hypothetical protein